MTRDLSWPLHAAVKLRTIVNADMGYKTGSSFDSSQLTNAIVLNLLDQYAPVKFKYDFF